MKKADARKLAQAICNTVIQCAATYDELGALLGRPPTNEECQKVDEELGNLSEPHWNRSHGRNDWKSFIATLGADEPSA